MAFFSNNKQAILRVARETQIKESHMEQTKQTTSDRKVNLKLKSKLLMATSATHSSSAVIDNLN
jgi:hypothetical protein